MKIFATSGLLILLIINFGACEPREKPLKKEISVLRIGVLPELSEQKLMVRHQSLFNCLADEAWIP